MKVLEIKNNLVKIAFDAVDNLALGGFVIIEDTNNPYVAQVMNLKSEPASNYAIVKLLFTFNDEGILKNYNGTIPSLTANVSKLPAGELLDIIPAEDPITLGSLAQQDVNLDVDKTILENNLLICSNNLNNTTTLLSNITEQISEKAIIIDTEGQFEWDRAIAIGTDFKLPLNFDTINYIYENDLEDIDAVSKAMIQDIIIEVQNYIQTLPERFLPFDTFISVIDSQYRETQIPQLILLKNKLLKYKELNVFADTLKDIMDLSITIENTKNISIDLSEIPEKLQKEVIRYIYSILNGMNEQIYCFVKVNNSNITKRLLKRYIARDNVFTTVICSHEFKYIEEIKEASQNIIFFAPLTLQHDFASYNSFLNKLNNDEFVIYGAHTQNIPFITEVTPVEESKEQEIVPMPEAIQETPEPEAINTVPADITIAEPIADEDLVEEVLQDDGIVNDFPEISYPDITKNEQEFEEEETLVEDDVNNNFEEEDTVIEPLQEDIYEEAPIENILEDNVVYDPIEEIGTMDNDIPQLTNDESDNEESIDELPQELSNDELVEQVAKDVDKVFYEKLPTEDEEFDTPEGLTEDDLNLIDDLSDDNEISLVGEEDIAEFDNFEEELPPVVPIYPAEENLDDEVQTFNAGDRVSTAKYGEGIVEKMIKYGNKMLCSIDFPNIGRRLLDPAITEITKLS